MNASQKISAFSLARTTISSLLESQAVQDKSSSYDVTIDWADNTTTEELSTLAPTNPFILPWWQQVFFIIIFLAMIIASIGGNLIVMWIVLWHKRMRTVTNYFLFNLALADALISVWNTLFNTAYLLYSNWWFGEDFCKFSMFVAPCTTSASVFTLMAIAIDRYLAIMRWVRMSAKVVIGLIVVIWLASCLISLPLAIYSKTETFSYADGSTRTLCLQEWPGNQRSSSVELGYNIFLIIVNYFLPMFILIVTYTFLGKELWGSKAIGENTSIQQQRVKAKQKVVKMMIVVVIIFAVCWLPMHLYFLLVSSFPSINSYQYIQQIFLIIYWMAMSNSMYNPIIYCWMNARFRQGFKLVFCIFPCVHVQKKRRPDRNMTLSMSMSDTKGVNRNGSLMHTTMENMEESCNSPETIQETDWKQNSKDDPAADDEYL
uniref:Tachykinin-like peptides receptor 99D n=3 Tax=Octopus TaxID=6643 RepID=A0A6C0PN72_OCTVU|nr:tachykinin-like peptides receptor 99D [Octopus vulgaris]